MFSCTADPLKFSKLIFPTIRNKSLRPTVHPLKLFTAVINIGSSNVTHFAQHLWARNTTLQKRLTGSLISGKSYRRGRFCTVDLLALTSLDQLLFILKISFSFLVKQPILMRRSTVLSLSFQLVFPVYIYSPLCGVSCRVKKFYSTGPKRFFDKNKRLEPRRTECNGKKLPASSSKVKAPREFWIAKI